jgi:RNA polymerase sigma-70 factor (ECF subfamily)
MDDNSLIDNILSGQKEYYQQLIERYQNKIYNYVHKILQNRTEAEDITQETFIKAYFALKSFKKEFKFSTWLYKIATNLCWNFLKKNKTINLENSIFERFESQDKSAIEKIEKEDESSVIHESIKKLLPKYRIVITLFYFDGLSLKEISRVLNLPEGTIKTHLYRAKNNLKEIIEEAYEE